LTTGDHMIIFEIWCRSSETLNTLLKKIEKFEGVSRICPAIFLRRVE
ncbi:Lrp/AsnC ligand binding domain-containing protein, partial [Candidatus Micrarchaeota archaeon]|nr:Lrp/AsnC ligand binding domain-containing protein [Candidatus Micrarchaeota archaeon]